MKSDVGVVYGDSFDRYNFGSFHPLKPSRWKLEFELLKAYSFLEKPGFRVFKPEKAEWEALLLFHEEGYLRKIEQASREGSGYLDLGDTPAFKGCFEAAAFAVGASVEAVELVAGGTVDVAFNLGGGFHHAHPSRASGFCIFNDVAVALAYLRRRRRVKRMLYLDIDAHQGDGVMYGFYEDPWVLNIDFHEEGIFPGTGGKRETGRGKGKGCKVNVPLPPFTYDDVYLEAFEKLVPPLAYAYKPEVILFQCGVDGHYKDPLTRLKLTTRTYETVAESLRKIAEELCGGRVVMFGGGGYNLDATSRCWALMLGKIAGLDLPSTLPQKWLDLYRETENSEPALLLRDEPLRLEGRMKEEVREKVGETVEEVKRRVFVEF